MKRSGGQKAAATVQNQSFKKGAQFTEWAAGRSCGVGGVRA